MQVVNIEQFSDIRISVSLSVWMYWFWCIVTTTSRMLSQHKMSGSRHNSTFYPKYNFQTKLEHSTGEQVSWKQVHATIVYVKRAPPKGSEARLTTLWIAPWANSPRVKNNSQNKGFHNVNYVISSKYSEKLEKILHVNWQGQKPTLNDRAWQKVHVLVNLAHKQIYWQKKQQQYSCIQFYSIHFSLWDVTGM